MTTLREAAQQALEALEDHATQYPHMQKGYTVDAIAALRAALEKEQDSFVGLELSEIDAAIDENIKITDYRLRDGVYGAIVDLECLLKEKNERR